MARGQAWSLDDKINAAFAYIVTGYAEQASQICAVPKRTINDWLKQEWFQGLIKEAQAYKQDQLDAQWTGLIHQTTDALKDRVLNGDIEYSKKTGEQVRVPVKARDLALLTSIIAEKRALLRGQVTSRVERISSKDRLDEIQKALEKPVIMNDSAEES